MQAMKEVAAKKNKEENNKIDIDLEDPDVDMAATKIQAGFKGMTARKEVAALKDKIVDEENGIDIDLEDPEV